MKRFATKAMSMFLVVLMLFGFAPFGSYVVPTAKAASYMDGTNARYFLAFLYNTRVDKVESKEQYDDFYKLLTGQLSGEHEETATFLFLQFAHTRIEQVLTRANKAVSTSTAGLLSYFEKKDDSNFSGDIVEDIINNMVRGVLIDVVGNVDDVLVYDMCTKIICSPTQAKKYVSDFVAIMNLCISIESHNTRALYQYFDMYWGFMSLKEFNSQAFEAAIAGNTTILIDNNALAAGTTIIPFLNSWQLWGDKLGEWAEFMYYMEKNLTGDSGGTWDSGGSDGNAQKPYNPYISTPQDLYNIRDNLDKTYILMNDIDLSSWGIWTPIGLSNWNTDNSFTGTLDGQGYVIKNLKVNLSLRDWRSNRGYGLFASISNATIRNVGMVGTDISVGAWEQALYAGAISGIASGTSVVSNCYNTGRVSLNDNANDRMAAGGLVGSSSATITNCFNSGTISTSLGANSNSTYAGGIAGENFGSISRCYNSGSVSGSQNGSWGRPNAYAGGIAGGEGTISSSGNTGRISSTAIYGMAHAGGISGAGSSIFDCLSSAVVTASSSTSNNSTGYQAYAGGISGHFGSVSRCYSVGTVTSSGYNTYAWGIGNGSVQNCVSLISSISAGSRAVYLIGSATTNSNNKAVQGIAGTNIIDDSNGKISGEEAKQQNTYSELGWNFATVWSIDASVNDGYPNLRGLIGNFAPFPTNAQAVASDKATLIWETIAGENSAITNVTENLHFLPFSGASGSLISWSSSNTSVVSNSGVVTRPAYGNGDGIVTLTATIRKGIESDTVVFKLTVKEESPSDVQVPPTIITATLTSGTVGTAYSQVLTATGDTPITWTSDSGNLPNGLTLMADGTISGTPRVSGTFNFTVKAANSAGNAAKELTIKISDLTYTVSVSSTDSGSTGSGDYAQGATVSISAGRPPKGQRFSHWTASPAVDFDDANSENTTFIMPANAVVVTVNFEPVGVPRDTGSAIFTSSTWVLSPDFSGELAIDSGTGWEISSLFYDGEQTGWTRDGSTVIVYDSSVTFSCIVKVTTGTNAVKYIGIEKPIGINAGTYDNSTWYLDALTDDAVLKVMDDWEVKAIFHDEPNNLVGYDDAKTVRVKQNAGSFDAIVKMEHIRIKQIKYIGISKQ